VSVYSESLGRPALPELVRIEQADDAVRISYSGTTLEAADREGSGLDLLAHVTSAALTLAQIERDNDYS